MAKKPKSTEAKDDIDDFITQMSVTRLDADRQSMISRNIGLRAVRHLPRSPACFPDSSRCSSAHCDTSRARRGASAAAMVDRQWARVVLIFW